MKKFSPAEQAVLKILAYAAVFRGSVLKSELVRYQSTPDRFSASELMKASTSLWKSGCVRHFDISGRALLAHEKWKQVGRAIQFLSGFSEIESIWVTGSLAVGNIQADDDVDFMIVTSSESVWWTRMLVIARDVFPRQVRRRHDENGRVQNKWCCNLWLEPSSLQLPSSQRSLYSAREVIQAVPVFQRRAGAASEFLLANSWVQDIFPEGFSEAWQRTRKLPVWSSFSSPLFPSALRRFLNRFLFSLQKRRMQAYRRHEIVELDRAFFHPGERAKTVLQEYERILQSLWE